MNTHQAEIGTLSDCAVACSACAAACLREEDPKPMATCVALDIDCAEACRLAIGFIARGSANIDAARALCRATCEACATECSRHAMDHCQACAAACRKCLEILGRDAVDDQGRVAAAIKRST